MLILTKLAYEAGVLMLLLFGVANSLLFGVFTPRNRSELAQAAALWDTNKEDATAKHGQIGGWDVSLVSDMQFLFHGMTRFDENLSSWNTAKVISMRGMFYGCANFRGAGVGNWVVMIKVR